MTYTVQFTNKNKTPIIIDDAQIDTSTDVTLFGRTRLAYGQSLQENLLHILENFSCPEDPYNPGNPNLAVSEDGIFHDPIEGQCWYNSTKGVLTFYDGTHWIPLARQDGVAANWGMLYDGAFLPNPVSSVSGKVFDYNECVYIVSPQSIPNKIDYYVCSADGTGKVTMKYREIGSDTLVSGIANFLIVGIAGNVNQSSPPIQPSPTPSITPTSSIAQSVTPTPTVTPSKTPPNTPPASQTPAVSPTRTPAPSATSTPAPSNTPQPSVSPTPSPVPPTLPFNGVQYSRTCVIPINGTGLGSIYLSMFTGGWQIQLNCHGSVSTLASGTLPSNAYTVQYATTYRPDLSNQGGTPYQGPSNNGAPNPSVLVSSSSTNVVSIDSKTVSGNTGVDYETTYTVQAIIRDINGNIIINSTCIFDIDVVGNA